MKTMIKKRKDKLIFDHESANFSSKFSLIEATIVSPSVEICNLPLCTTDLIYYIFEVFFFLEASSELKLYQVDLLITKIIIFIKAKWLFCLQLLYYVLIYKVMIRGGLTQ
jgi:hypothetical protein